MGGSQRAGPHSPRGAALYCTVAACLVLTRQVNSTSPSHLSFFSFVSFVSIFFRRSLSLYSAFQLPRLLYCESRISQRLPIIANCFFIILLSMVSGLYVFVIRYLDWSRKSLRRLKGFLQDFRYRGSLEEGWLRLISLVLWYSVSDASFLKEKQIDAFSSNAFLHLCILYL